jgi:hypothetical protein
MKLKYGTDHITAEMWKNPEAHVPAGMYCHGATRGDRCPFWDFDVEMPRQENGYCHLLRESDWDMNIESLDTTTLEYDPQHPELVGKTMRELLEVENCPVPMLGTSLLWDQCKECGINDED